MPHELLAQNLWAALAFLFPTSESNMKTPIAHSSRMELTDSGRTCVRRSKAQEKWQRAMPPSSEACSKFQDFNEKIWGCYVWSQRLHARY